MMAVKRNILANFFGRGWSLLMGFVFVPLYIQYMGMEAYGLVGFSLALQATVHLLEFGLSATINRELARYSVRPDRADEARDLARTLETVYWIIGLGIGVCLYGCAPWLSAHWIRTETLPIETVTHAVAMMGMSIAFQWPIGLYSGGMMGLERQVALNGLVALLGTIRGLGAVLALWLIAPTITVFFAWQIAISVVQVATMAVAFWHVCPSGSRAARVDLGLLRGVWRFAAGMGATGVTTFLLSQFDKIALSRILPLSLFGHYNVANQVNTAARMSGGSVFIALLPRMSAVLACEDDAGTRILFHKACQCVSWIVLPVSAILAFFSEDLIHVWTRSGSVASMAAPIASVLVVGSAFNSMMGIPYDLTVAHGWAIYGFYQNLISAVILVPTMLVLAGRFGGLGAACAWLALNVGYFLVAAPIIFRRVLPGELRRWYLVDVGTPLVLSFALAGLGRWLIPRDQALWVQTLAIMALWLVTQVVCGFALPEMARYMVGLGRCGSGLRDVLALGKSR